MMTETETIGERVKRARMRAAISQEQLANASGVSEATINRIERGLISTLRFQTVNKIAPTLGVDPGWLLTGESGRDA